MGIHRQGDQKMSAAEENGIRHHHAEFRARTHGGHLQDRERHGEYQKRAENGGDARCVLKVRSRQGGGSRGSREDRRQGEAVG